MERSGKVRLRRVNVKSWTSAVAKQCKIRSLPTLWLYKGSKIVSRKKEEILATIMGLPRR